MRIVAISLLLVFTVVAHAQTPKPDSTHFPDTLETTADTIAVDSAAVYFSAPAPWDIDYDRRPVDSVFAVVPTRSPMGAFWRSAAVPGWGQFYNGSVAKGLAAVLTEGATWTTVIVRHLRAKDADREAVEVAAYDTVRAHELRELADHHRDVRNGYIWLGAALTLLWSFEAYVDAHLEGLRERPLCVTPTWTDGPGVSFTIDLPQR
jgi:hypothetical protein